MNQEGPTEKKSTGKMGTKKTAKKAAYPPDDQAAQAEEEYGHTEKKAAGYSSGSESYPGESFGGTEKKGAGSPGTQQGSSGGSAKKAAYSDDGYGSTEKKSVGDGLTTEEKHGGGGSTTEKKSVGGGGSGSAGGTTEKKNTGESSKPSKSKEAKIRHTVQEGETLGSIAEQYMLPSWKYLYQINKKIIGDNPDILNAGSELTIPSWDSTSGDEKIQEKGARPFSYTGGLRYRDVWVPFKAVIRDADGNLKQFEEKTSVKVTDRGLRHTFAELEITSTEEIQMLLPDSVDVNVGVRGFPFSEGEVRHVHPDDVPEGENETGQTKPPETSRKTEQEHLDDILDSET